jgi:hypothetical protein
VINFLHTKKFNLSGIIAELATADGEQACAKKAVENWVHQVKLGRTAMEDEMKPGRLLLDDLHGRILACLSCEPFFRVRSIAQVLGLAPATVHRRLMIFLEMKPRHFRWILNLLTVELWEQSVNSSRALFDVLQRQEKIHFRGIITGHESSISIDSAPSSIWFWLHKELLTCPRATISADKRMVVVFWDQKRYTRQRAIKRFANERSLLP